MLSHFVLPFPFTFHVLCKTKPKLSNLQEQENVFNLFFFVNIKNWTVIGAYQMNVEFKYLCKMIKTNKLCGQISTKVIWMVIDEISVNHHYKIVISVRFFLFHSKACAKHLNWVANLFALQCIHFHGIPIFETQKKWIDSFTKWHKLTILHHTFQMQLLNTNRHRKHREYGYRREKVCFVFLCRALWHNESKQLNKHSLWLSLSRQ